MFAVDATATGMLVSAEYVPGPVCENIRRPCDGGLAEGKHGCGAASRQKLTRAVNHFRGTLVERAPHPPTESDSV